MTSYEEKSVQCAHVGGFHSMVYSDWGPQESTRTIVCVHGLTRNGRDFERVAKALGDYGLRVLVPDIVGRGRSDWLGPLGNYEIPQYIQDLTVMLAAENLTRVDWLGTSMGGLIGMAVAAMQNSPISRLMINDVGPFIPRASLERIGGYVGMEWRFADMEEAVSHMRQAYAPFGLSRDEDWEYLTSISVMENGRGGYTNAYDRRIADPFRNQDITDIDLWSVWDAITVPVKVLRGEESDLLRPETAVEMQQRGPGAQVTEIRNCGHAPSLMTCDQIRIVQDWALPGFNERQLDENIPIIS